MGVSPAVTWHQVASDEQSLALIPLPGWQPNTCYTLEVRSAQGSPNPTFFTRRLASFSGATQGRDPETPISLAFLYPVDACSVEQALHLEPETPYRLSWSGQTLYLKPETSWDVETTYTLTLGAEARDSAGMPLGKPLSWNFTIRSLVAGFSPQTKVFPCTAIAITFNRPADRKSVEAAFHITPTLAGTFEWQENALRFVP